MHTSLTCIINKRNIFGTEQALVPCQLLNMFHHTFISQLPFLLSRGKEQALFLFKCISLPALLVCLCSEAVQMDQTCHHPSFETVSTAPGTAYIYLPGHAGHYMQKRVQWVHLHQKCPPILWPSAHMLFICSSAGESQIPGWRLQTPFYQCINSSPLKSPQLLSKSHYPLSIFLLLVKGNLR